MPLSQNSKQRYLSSTSQGLYTRSPKGFSAIAPSPNNFWFFFACRLLSTSSFFLPRSPVAFFFEWETSFYLSNLRFKFTISLCDKRQCFRFGTLMGCMHLPDRKKSVRAKFLVTGQISEHTSRADSAFSKVVGDADNGTSETEKWTL